jgi:hypothetical protein
MGMLTASRTPLEELTADFLVSGQARRLSQGIERVDQVNQRVLDRYAAMLNSKTTSKTGKPLSAASLHSYLRTVNTFLGWCRREGENVSAKGSLPRLGGCVIDVFTPEQVTMEETEMGSMLVHEFINLDRIFDEPKWTVEYAFDPKMGDAIAAVMGSSKAILLGPVAYKLLALAWSKRTAEEDPGAPFMNESPKYMVSATLKSAN